MYYKNNNIIIETTYIAIIIIYLLFCQQTGCTNLKVAFFMSQGLLSESVINIQPHTIVSHDVLKDAQTSCSFSNVFPNLEKKQQALREYFKFLMYRHPIERLASGYRDKITHWHPPYRELRQKVFSYANPGEQYIEEPGTVKISFSDFISYWLDNDMEDEHFKPIFDLCDPCRVRYDYYGQFKEFNKHAAVLLDKIGGKTDFLLEDNYSDPSKKTDLVLEELYNQVSDEDKRRVLKRLSQDIDFYYHIYPDEINTHKETLNLPDELTLPY